MKLAENLRFLRTAKGLSQTALAEALDLKRGNISSYEKGLAQPSIQNLINISKYFHVHVESLVEKDLEREGEIEEENIIEKFSHSKWVKNIKEGVQYLTHKVAKPEHIEKLKDRNEDLSKVLEGFKAYHKYRMENLEMNESTIKSISQDYENILQILDTLLKSNYDLIKVVESHQ